jgi:hypothetical protein
MRGGGLSKGGIIRSRRSSITGLFDGSVSLNTVYLWSQRADGKTEVQRLRGAAAPPRPIMMSQHTLEPSSQHCFIQLFNCPTPPGLLFRTPAANTHIYYQPTTYSRPVTEMHGFILTALNLVQTSHNWRLRSHVRMQHKIQHISNVHTYARAY